MRNFIIFLLIFVGVGTYGQEATVIFKSGDDGYSSYRIPAIIKAKNGTLLAFAEARREGISDTGDIDLVLKRSIDGGKSWGKLEIVWDDGVNVCGNPAPVVLDSGEIVMVMTWNLGSDHEHQIMNGTSEDTRRVFVVQSNDNGATWSEPKDITSQAKRDEWGWYATGPCHAIIKTLEPHKGRIVVPANHSVMVNGKAMYRAHILYSDDMGESWEIGAISQDYGNESGVVELENGYILQNMRAQNDAYRYRLSGLSADGGESWVRESREYALIEPVCQGSILGWTKRDKPTSTILFCNPRSNTRSNLTICISEDSGLSWRELCVVTPGMAAYSDIIQLDNRRVGVIYESGDSSPYEGIYFVSLALR
jgi:sialidase-1